MGEQWKTISDFPDFAVSNLGEVKSQKTGHILTTHLKCGSPFVNLTARRKYKKTIFSASRKVANLVGKAFLPIPLNLMKEPRISVVYRTDNRADCSVNNLMWVAGDGKSRKVKNSRGEEFLTVKVAARHMGVHPQSIYTSIWLNTLCQNMKWEWAS